VSLLFSTANSQRDVIQIRLIRLAVVFHFIGCSILTLAPVVRYHSWTADLRWQQWVGFIVWLAGFLYLNRQTIKRLPDRDPYLLPLVSLLTAWGLLTIYRLIPAFGFRQTAWLAICFALFFLVIRFSKLLPLLRRYKYVWLSAGLVLTLLTFILGVYPGGVGPNLWLNFFGVYLQPSEILKILLIIYLAAYLADNLHVRFKFLQLMMPTMIIAGIAFLILVGQRDLGTASLFVVLYAVVLYLATGRRRVLLISFFTIVAALVAGYVVFDVIQLRIEAWLNPWLDPNGKSYQIVQSIIATANGGIFGRGIGLGSPGVVPVAHSDFIFSAIFEETGLLGAGALLLLLAFFAVRGFSIALHAPNNFQRFLAAGITTTFIGQAILIIGGSIRMLPLTGVTLPFVSYGGSSLVSCFFSAALLVVISNQSEDRPIALERSQPYLLAGSVFLAAIAALLLISGWWGFIRSESLLLRNDNPRRFISDQYVHRGAIFDRNNDVLVKTIGIPGEYSRSVTYPSLSAVVGYSDAGYGQAGLEASQDDLLRGITEDNYSEQFKARLLYSQFPPGHDIRISIDLTLQQTADNEILGQTGSVIVLNAQSGEILAMATSPTFDSNQLSASMESWKTDPASPLLNRATQGLYPPGSATGGLILNYMVNHDLLFPANSAFNRSSRLMDPSYCALQPIVAPDLVDLIIAGCPRALEEISTSLQPVDIYTLYQQSGFLEQPEIQIESSTPNSLDSFTNYSKLFRGDSELLVTPIQMALAYAPFSNGGFFVEPSIVLAYRNGGEDWKLVSESPGSSTATNMDYSETIHEMVRENQTGWAISSTVPTESGHLDWFIQGTPADWKGVPIVVVVALENSTAIETKEKGTKIFSLATSQLK
jgi:cell division protein FtsW (lipid II flippase)